jgi:heat shock protein HslJ
MRLFNVFLVVLLLFHPGCKKSTSIPDNPLSGVKWILQSIRYSDQNIVQIGRVFFIRFNEDLSFEMQVDCNSCSGTYVLGAGNSLSFNAQMACTDAYCGDNSPDDEFHAAIETVSRYEKIGNRLQIYFNNGQSFLDFMAGTYPL